MSAFVIPSAAPMLKAADALDFGLWPQAVQALTRRADKSFVSLIFESCLPYGHSHPRVYRG